MYLRGYAKELDRVCAQCLCLYLALVEEPVGVVQEGPSCIEGCPDNDKGQEGLELQRHQKHGADPCLPRVKVFFY